MTSLMEIGQSLVDNCRAGTERECLDQLYSREAVSVEAMASPEMGGAAITGLDAIKGKHDWWQSAFTVHDLQIGGPYIHGEDRFAVTFKMDTEEKATGKRDSMQEVAVYTVADGKIVREEFFYTP